MAMTVTPDGNIYNPDGQLLFTSSAGGPNIKSLRKEAFAFFDKHCGRRKDTIRHLTLFEDGSWIREYRSLLDGTLLMTEHVTPDGEWSLHDRETGNITFEQKTADSWLKQLDLKPNPLD